MSSLILNCPFLSGKQYHDVTEIIQIQNRPEISDITIYRRGIELENWWMESNMDNAHGMLQFLELTGSIYLSLPTPRGL